MLTEPERQLMMSLNDRIQHEENTEKLLLLIGQLNQLLDNAEERAEALQRGLKF